MKRTRGSALSCILLVGVLESQATRAEDTLPGQPARVIPMRLEIALDSTQCLTYENITFRLQITNPNPFAVKLSGFEFAYDAVKIDGTTADEAFQRRYVSNVSPLRKTPVEIGAHGSIEHHRFLWPELGAGYWLDSAGIRELRVSLGINNGWDSEGHPVGIGWQSDPVKISVEEPTGANREAMEFLWDKIRARDAFFRRPNPGGDINLLDYGLCRDFLSSFKDTAYAPEIWWHMAQESVKLLDPRLPEQELADRLRWFEESVRFCLNRGSPYADDYLTWDPQSAGNDNRTLTGAVSHKRWDLVERILPELARTHPSEAERITYITARRVHERGGADLARRLLETLQTATPHGKYTERAKALLDQIRAQESPPATQPEGQRE